MTIKVPRSRRFPQRENQEDVKAQIAVVLKEKGANNHFQAQFYVETCREVVGSTEFKFSTLQPKIKIKDDKEDWQTAYDFIFDFLQKNKMDLTIQAMNIEFELKKEKPVLVNLFDGISRDQYFDDLIEQAKNSVDFSTHVQNFAAEEGI